MDVLTKGQQLRLLAHRAASARHYCSSIRPARSRMLHSVVAQARQSAALRELQEQHEERATQALESRTPVGAHKTHNFNESCFYSDFSECQYTSSNPDIVSRQVDLVPVLVK